MTHMDESVYEQSFSRNLGILSRAEQERLRKSSVAIAGLGGIGGSTMILLARMGVGRFRVADFDTFDLPNINRQYGARIDTIGMPKVAVLADEVRRINPAARVDVFPGGFTSNTGDALLDGADIAVDAIDFYAIDTHLEFHRATRRHGLFTLMGSPVGFSACLQIFDPKGMSLEEYCDLREDAPPLEKQLRYACGLVPALAHIAYFDVSAGASNTDFISGTGPSTACACALAASLVATEAVLILLRRRPPRCVPHTFQFDPYTFRYEKCWTPGGMANYDPEPAIASIPDRSSLVPQVLELFYRKRRSLKAPVNGVELYYKVEGEGDPLLLITPLGADCGFWARQAQTLSRCFRVITFDNRGSGASTHCDTGCSTELMAQDACMLLDYLGVERAHIVGLALGGLVAQRIALERPELVGGLVLASCYAAANEPLREVTEDWRRTATEAGMAALFDQCIPLLFSEAYVADSMGELGKLKTFFRLTLQEPACFRAQCMAGILHDTRDRLAEISVPVLVVHGEADRLVSVELATELARGLPDARLLLLPEAPHFLTWEHADRFNREVTEFLSVVKSARVTSRAAAPCV